MFLSNIRFICRQYFRSARSIFVYFFLSMAAMLAAPVLSVYLPRVVMQAVTEGWGFARLAAWVGALALGIALMNVVITVSGLRFTLKAAVGRLEMGLLLEEMNMTCRYDLTEDPAWQTKISEAGNAIYSDSRSQGITGMVYSLRDFVINGMGIFAFSAILGMLHPVILVILVFTSVVPGILANRVNLYAFRQRERWLPYDRQSDYVYKHATATKAGKEVRVYGASGFFLGKMEEAVRKRLLWARKISKRQLGADGVSALMAVCQNGLALGWIAYEVIQGKIGVADFAFYSGAAIQFAKFMNQFVESYSVVKRCSQSVQMVREALVYLPKERPVLQELPVGCPIPEIRFEHVSFTYPGAAGPALRDVSFRIGPGEKLALVGVNGAGKSTLVKLLCGLYQPGEGRILIDGKPMWEIEEGERYSLFSAVFQDMLVLPFSVLENVAVSGKADVDRVRRCLEEAGLSERFPNLNQPLVKGIQDGAQNLSGGEEQKLLLARALYKEAPILILDEPTAALDPLAESELYQRYHALTEGKSCLYISHRLASTRFCDRILLLGEGGILEEGSHEELLARGGEYAHMFHEQSKYYRDKDRDKEGKAEAEVAGQ